ncbi:MAG: peptidoglycan editing factor PgeF [Phycisphaerae bacterium]
MPLQRINLDGVVIYLSPLLASARVPHGFSARLGGVSTGPFASLNLGNPLHLEARDPPEHIAENYRRLMAACGMAGRRRHWLHQVHGGRCVVAGQTPLAGEEQADALATADAASCLSVRVADCTPVLFADRAGRRVAAAHAGWRGTVAGVALAALAALETPPADVLVAVGPAISVDAFEVGPEVLAQFDTAFTRRAEGANPDGKGFVDLQGVLVKQLTDAGVPPAQIDVTDRCTFRDEVEFFSHRRDNGLTGRMAALIGPA